MADATNDDRTGVTAPIVMTLAWALVPIPIAGWFVAPAADAAISGWGFYETYAKAFAFLLLVSALINAVLVTRIAIDRPVTFVARGYPLWQSLTVGAALLWLVSLILAGVVPTPGTQLALGIAVVLTSVGATIFATTTDPRARARRSERLDARRRRGRLRYRFWCPDRDSNPDLDDFKSSASANWAIGAERQSA